MHAMFVLIDDITLIYLEQPFNVFKEIWKHGGCKLETEIADGA